MIILVSIFININGGIKMAFETKTDQLRKALGTNTVPDNIEKSTSTSEREPNKTNNLIESIKNTDEHENRKPFTFTLQPSVRKLLTTIRKQTNYRSDSELLNEIIKMLSEDDNDTK